MIFLHPNYHAAIDRILPHADIYQRVLASHTKALRNCRHILDSGAGSGILTRRLLREGHVVTAVERHKPALDQLREKCGLHPALATQRANAVNLPFEDNSFDGIASVFVAEFNDNEQYLREQLRVLKPGGILVLTSRSTWKKGLKVADSYERSLQRKGLMSKLGREMQIVRETIKRKHGIESDANLLNAQQMVQLMSRLGYQNIRVVRQPFFKSAYTIQASKEPALNPLV